MTNFIAPRIGLGLTIALLLCGAAAAAVSVSGGGGTSLKAGDTTVGTGSDGNLGVDDNGHVTGHAAGGYGASVAGVATSGMDSALDASNDGASATVHANGAVSPPPVNGTLDGAVAATGNVGGLAGVMASLEAHVHAALDSIMAALHFGGSASASASASSG